jgi:hypothetical protein
MSRDWSIDLSKRGFRPRHVSKITGIDSRIARGWIDRYDLQFSGNTGSSSENNSGQNETHQYWFWADIQKLAMFNEVMADLNRGELAKAFVFGTETENWRIQMRQQKFNYDFSTNPDGDLLIVAKIWGDDLVSRFGEAGGSLVADFNLPPDLKYNEGCEPTRLYAYNFSQMQRNLLKAYSAFKEAEGGTK